VWKGAGARDADRRQRGAARVGIALCVLGEYPIHHPHQRQDIISNSRSLQHFDEQHILPPLYRWLEGTSASMPAERVVLHEKTTPAEDETLAREGERHLLL
jgi:hypothetical protein